VRPRLVLAAAFTVVLVAACSGDGGPVASSTGARPSVTGPSAGTTGPTTTGPTTTTVTTTTQTIVPTPTGATGPDADVRVPADTPTTVDDPMDLARIDAGDLSSLVPPGADVGFRQVLAGPSDPIDQISVTWDRGNDVFAAQHGFVVWQRSGGTDGWRAVYAFTDPARRAILGLAPLQSGDLTGDGMPETLTLEQQGGSGTCGITRVISSSVGDAREIFRASACDTQIDIVGDHLERREAVFGPNDPHCCPSSFRVTTLEWNGTAFEETGSTTEDA
jgi:hypothetical protein